MSVTTKTGDKGSSSFRGKKVAKDSHLLEAVGALDELQALVSVVKLHDIALDLYEIMAEVAYEKKNENIKARVVILETEIQKWEERLGEINSFLIFKKDKASLLNWVRTVARRVERRLVALHRTQQIDLNILIYINRLSDYLFMLARRAEEE